MNVKYSFILKSLFLPTLKFREQNETSCNSGEGVLTDSTLLRNIAQWYVLASKNIISLCITSKIKHTLPKSVLACFYYACIYECMYVSIYVSMKLLLACVA